ncbi:hypothetical protein F4780DRAFT_772330 [Xylariomycetidae sp. FL0641]|nr:hypothetical protein F4780DRAFT_772330 [Xylariomycetidae sp. FL0641]
MTHIAACLLDSDGETSDMKSYIANVFASEASTESLVPISSAEEKKAFPWRMQNAESRKYQLFPKDTQLPALANSKQAELDQSPVMATNQAAEKMEKSDKPSLTSGLRMRIKEHNLNRRRKVSVPELGPMTTVQEVSMDSPTIPGRPPAVHERSISTPVNTMRERDYVGLPTGPRDHIAHKATAAAPYKQPLSPKDLAPLTIPPQNATIAGLGRKLSVGRNRSGSAQQEQGGKIPRADDSPKGRAPYTPFTPYSSSSTIATPRSAITAVTSSTLPTPVSAPAECRQSPKPWERTATSPATISSPSTTNEMTPRADADLQFRSGSAQCHKRAPSDSGSIMERGRPRKRSDGSAVGAGSAGFHKRAESKRCISADRRAFETLPQGWKSTEAVKHMEEAELVQLQQQALGQALRFEVLRKEDVEGLSKELRHLDERTEYLRRTYTSLRAGRRNLHTRICQYLRSPRVAKFSYDSMLKQEEALAELDTSIDDWVTKLDQAENRRTRVRQKLLEHVAAASMLALPSSEVSGVSESLSLQQAIGLRMPPSVSDPATPPRSPTKSRFFYGQPPSPSPTPSASPQRVVARVPSAIPEAPVEESDLPAPLANQDNCQCPQSPNSPSSLARMESIRIYADSEVYALLADVENEFTKLNGETTSVESSRRSSSEEEEEEKVAHRNRSHEKLNGGSDSSINLDKTPPLSPPAPSPPSKDSPANEPEFLLTAAVFQPHQATTVGA